MKYPYKELEDGTIAVDIGKLIVDEEDVEIASNVYISISIYEKEKSCSLARKIMNPLNGLVVDHINNNSLDNRKCNLRICTYKENNLNMRKRFTIKHNFVKRDDGFWEYDPGPLLIDKENLHLINRIFISIRKTNGTSKKELLHRLIVKIDNNNNNIDHINMNRMDNRKINLRICTKKENMMNRKSHINSTSKYKGVSWNKTKEKWACHFKNYNLGDFDDEVLAAKTYDCFAKHIFKEFAYLNFPNEKLLDIDVEKEILKKKTKKYSSKYKGISLYKNKKWRARIYIEGKEKTIGYFDNEEEAYIAYQNYINKIKKRRR
jgi:hypothetical protein